MLHDSMALFVEKNGIWMPQYTKEQVNNCSFDVWYPKLAHISIKSTFIPLPKAFLDLLLEDGVTLKITNYQEELKQLQNQIEEIIKNQPFNGKVFVKLNWSSPRDASWMLGTLQCKSFEDVFLLLKSSDFILHDLIQAYRNCYQEQGEEEEQQQFIEKPHVLVLKKWCNFYDSMLFRCFIINHRLVGISQRNIDEFYPFLFNKQDHLCELIYTFVYQHFINTQKFPDKNYILDVYIDQQDRVFLLDINVFGNITSPLLFTWKELKDAADTVPLSSKEEEEEEEQQVTLVDFRIVESEKAIQPNPLSSYRTPTDFMDHLVGGEGFEAFIQQVQRDNTAANSNGNASESENQQEEEEEEEDDDDEDWDSDHYD